MSPDPFAARLRDQISVKLSNVFVDNPELIPWLGAHLNHVITQHSVCFHTCKQFVLINVDYIRAIIYFLFITCMMKVSSFSASDLLSACHTDLNR